MTRYVGAIDQGTTSTRFIVFDDEGKVVGVSQAEHRQHYPRPGWVEHDPAEIWERTQQVIAGGLTSSGLSAADLAAVGITNQRETTVVWNRETAEPIGNAIVWQDTRTAEICAALAGEHGPDRFREVTGLPLATYFSGPKLRWLLDHAHGLAAAVERGDIMAGTIDTWLAWNLTGGADGGLHVTDVTNAGRTMLMNLHTLDWDEGLLGAFGVPRDLLPDIRPSSGVLGVCAGVLQGVPLAGVLGDQHAALFGQGCYEPGEAKNTYGTGCFLLLNTGPEPVPSRHGLLTTLAYQLTGEGAVYALEGSIAVAGALVGWLRDNLGIIDEASAIEALAASVEDNGDVYFVPAFSGLFAPHWRGDARGAIVGLTRFATKAHLARAALEATAYQTRDVLEAMEADAGIELNLLKVDGGMVANQLLMQFQADILGVSVVRPEVAETTALGAAYAAGLAVGVWSDLADLRMRWYEHARWEPRMVHIRREELYTRWKQAVERTLDWV